MRIPLVALVLLAAAAPVRAAAQSADAAAGDSIPANAQVVDERELTARPELTNRPVIRRLMERNYPRALREEGRTGMVRITMLIDPTGTPRLLTVTGPSGVSEFDEAALKVVRAMRFTAPVKDGAPVWVRVSIPVEFSTTP